jgi:hypothetical protein
MALMVPLIRYLFPRLEMLTMEHNRPLCHTANVEDTF